MLLVFVEVLVLSTVMKMVFVMTSTIVLVKLTFVEFAMEQESPRGIAIAMEINSTIWGNAAGLVRKMRMEMEYVMITETILV
jgi:hypothetical protein